MNKKKKRKENYARKRLSFTEYCNDNQIKSVICFTDCLVFNLFYSFVKITTRGKKKKTKKKVRRDCLITSMRSIFLVSYTYHIYICICIHIRDDLLLSTFRFLFVLL